MGIWPGLSERCHRCHDQPRIFLFQTCMIQTTRGQPARREAFDDHVDLPRHPPQHVGTFLGVQVQRDAALVQVHQQEEQAFFRIGIGVAIALGIWPVLSASALRRFDPEALKARFIPTATIESAQETMEWLKRIRG